MQPPHGQLQYTKDAAAAASSSGTMGAYSGQHASRGGGATIDLRGLGGYVVMPPSRRDDGRGWRWMAPPTGLAREATA
jgi:hypothetical protein